MENKTNSAKCVKHIESCAYMNCDKGECRILTEKVCIYKRCSFFRSRIEYERNKNRDYLYESFLKGDVSRQRYIDLCKTYPSVSRTILQAHELGGIITNSKKKKSKS